MARRAGEGNKQCEGWFLRTSPRRGTLSFVTQKFFCFGAINNRRNYWLGTSFLLSHRMGVYPNPQTVSSHLQAPYIKHSMVLCICYKYVLIRPSEKWWCAEQQWSEAQSYRPPWSHSPDRHTWCSQRCKRYHSQSKYEWARSNRQPNNDRHPQR